MKTFPKSLLFPAILLVGLMRAMGSPPEGAAPAPPQSQEGYIGVGYQNLTPELARERKVSEMKGVLITEVSPQSPGAAAGLKETDVIVEIDGKEIVDDAAFGSMIRQIPPGRKIVVKFIRGGQVGTATITIGEMPPVVACLRSAYEKANHGDLPGATADYTEAIRLDPKNAKAFLSRGMVRANNGDLPGAIADFTEAVRLDPKNANACLYRGMAKGKSGDLPGAIVDFTEAVRLDPLDAKACLYRGMAKADSGDLPGAITDFTEAARLDPKNADACLNRGMAKGRNGDLPAAIADFTEAIRLDPKNAMAYFNRAFARQNKGDLEGAIADYNEVIRLDPKNANAYLNRGLAKTNPGVRNGGKKPRRSEVAAAQKRSAEAMADYTEASRLYTEAIRDDPNNSLAYEYRAAAKDQLGDKDGAAQDRAASARIKEQVASARFREEVAKLSLPELLASSEKTEANARERNRAIVAAKSQQLPGILRDRKTDELSVLAVKIEQTILDLNHESEVAKDHAQQVTATNGDPKQSDELRGLSISYRERIELLKPIAAAIKDEIANRNR